MPLPLVGGVTAAWPWIMKGAATLSTLGFGYMGAKELGILGGSEEEQHGYPEQGPPENLPTSHGQDQFLATLADVQHAQRPALNTKADPLTRNLLARLMMELNTTSQPTMDDEDIASSYLRGEDDFSSIAADALSHQAGKPILAERLSKFTSPLDISQIDPGLLPYLSEVEFD